MNQNRLTVLLVGGNLDEQETKAVSLREAGYTVLTAADGSEGFRLTRRETPDLIVSEVDLPGFSGSELCRMIRDDRYLRATPFILTGEIFDDRNTISEALEAGADDYLPAYFHAQYLVAKADWLIHRKYAHENMKEHYEVVRSRQSRIANVVKETSVLIRDLDLELKRGRLDMAETQEDRNNIDRRIGLGVGMIGAIADLLEEQVKAMNVWEPVPSVPAHSGYQYAGANIDEQKISHLVPDRF